MYPAFARASRGRFHVKTAGTSYLEALRVVARHDEALFRRIIDFGRGRYDTDKATYHVSATVAGSTARQGGRRRDRTGAPLPGTVGPGAGGQAVSRSRAGRFCTARSGRRCAHAELGPAIVAVLHAHPDTYGEVLADHFARHLGALRAGLS